MVFLHLCTTVRYVTFTTNLTILRKNKTVSTLTQALMIPLLAPLTLLLFGFLLDESPENYLPIIFFLPKLDFGIMFNLPLKLRKVLSQISFAISSIYLLSSYAFWYSKIGAFPSHKLAPNG